MYRTCLPGGRYPCLPGGSAPQSLPLPPPPAPATPNGGRCPCSPGGSAPARALRFGIVLAVLGAGALLLDAGAPARAKVATTRPVPPSASGPTSTLSATVPVPTTLPPTNPAAPAPIQIEIALRSERNGSGSLRVHYAMAPDARSTIGRFRLADLPAGGWTAAITDSGFTAQAVFRSPVGANRSLRALGPAFRSLNYERRRSLFSIRNRLRGQVDLTGGLATFGDDVVRQRLGSDLGADPAAVAAQLGVTPQNLIALRLTASIAGASRQLSLPIGSATEVSVGSTSTRTDVLFPLCVAVAALALIVGRGVFRTRVRRGYEPSGGSRYR